MRELAHACLDLILDDIENLPDKPVIAWQDQASLVDELAEPLPRKPLGGHETLETFATRVLPKMTRVNHPRFHGFIPVPGSFYGFLGLLLSAGTNPFVGSWLGGASIAALEVIALRWLAEAVNYPSDAGLLTSGGSMANLVGLAAARARLSEDDRKRAVVYFTDQGHTSAQKAALTLGFHEGSLVTLATDDSYRLRPEILALQIREDSKQGLIPLALCANAGTTNSGAVDPLDDLANVCQDHDVWLHVDAAYGGFVALLPEGRQLLAGLDRADSLTLDPHKWLYAPMGVGCLLTKHQNLLGQAFHTDGDYLKQVSREQVNFFDRGPELSRPGRALAVWFLLRAAGVDQIAAEIREDLRLAALAAERLESSELFELLAPVELSVVCFRMRLGDGAKDANRAAATLELYEALLSQGQVLLSTTELHGVTALRLVVVGHRTTEEELDRTWQILHSTAAEIAAARAS